MAEAWLLIKIGAVFLAGLFAASVWNKNKNKVKAAIAVGALLSFFDFILENIGKITGYWESLQGSFYILHVPIEIMFITFFGGIFWSLMLPTNRHTRFSIVFMLVGILFGVFFESKLVDIGLFAYGNGWTSFHALAVYTIIIFLMHETFYWAYAKFSGGKFKWISFDFED